MRFLMMETLFDSKTLFLPPNHSAIYTARIAATCVDIFLRSVRVCVCEGAHILFDLPPKFRRLWKTKLYFYAWHWCFCFGICLIIQTWFLKSRNELYDSYTQLHWLHFIRKTSLMFWYPLRTHTKLNIEKQTLARCLGIITVEFPCKTQDLSSNTFGSF